MNLNNLNAPVLNVLKCSSAKCYELEPIVTVITILCNFARSPTILNFVGWLLYFLEPYSVWNLLQLTLVAPRILM